MTRIGLGACLALVLGVATACSPHADSSTPADMPQQEEEDVNAVQRMRDYRYADSVYWKGHTYVYEVVRCVDDSMSVVTDDDGRRYADNFIRLTISRAGKTFFNRRFTKKTFDAYLNADFKKNAILEGMAFDTALPEGLRFSTSVSYPLSDMCVPFTITVAVDGSMSIAREEVLDNVVESIDTL